MTGTNHLWLLIQLRWRIFLNGLRKKNRQAELGINAAGSILTVIFWVVSTAAFGGVAYTQLEGQGTKIIAILLWVIFVTWQLEAIISSAGVNFQEIARYPISFRLFLFLNVCYGIFDPSAFLRMLWLFAVWVGIAAARPEWKMTAAGLFVLFALFNVLSHRVLSGLFRRFQTSRKGREIITIMTLMMGVFFQVVVRTWSRGGGFHASSSLANFLEPAGRVVPPGLVAHGLGMEGIPFWPISFLLVYSLTAFVWLWFQSRRTYEGEIYSESATVRRERKVQTGWVFVGGDQVFDAIVEKEFRYIRQNPRVIFQMLYVPVVAMIPIISQGFGDRGVLGSRRMDFFHGLFAAFLVHGATNLAYNIFGMDHTGFSRWLVAPVSLRKVMIGKNLTHGAIVAAIYLVVSSGLIAFSLISWFSFVTTTVAFAAFLIIILGAGNMVSVYWPKRIDPNQPRSRVISKAAGYSTLLILAFMTLFVGIAVLGVRKWELEWFPFGLSVAALLLALKLYSTWSNRAVNYLQDHLEEMSSELCS